jgi:hypothetical protein
MATSSLSFLKNQDRQIAVSPARIREFHQTERSLDPLRLRVQACEGGGSGGVCEDYARE